MVTILLVLMLLLLMLFMAASTTLAFVFLHQFVVLLVTGQQWQVEHFFLVLTIRVVEGVDFFDGSHVNHHIFIIMLSLGGFFFRDLCV